VTLSEMATARRTGRRCWSSFRSKTQSFRRRAPSKTLDADEEHFHEATGNEGPPFERTYRRGRFCALAARTFLWVLNQAGLSVTLLISRT